MMRGWGKKSDGDWSVLACEWWAMTDQRLSSTAPAGQNMLFQRPDGRVTQVVSWRENGSNKHSFTRAWEEVQSAGREARLWPLARWGRDPELTDPASFAWRSALPWEVWDSLIPWGPMRVPVAKLSSFADRMGVAALACQRHRRKLFEAWERLIEQAPDEARDLFRSMGRMADHGHLLRLTEGTAVPDPWKERGKTAHQKLTEKWQKDHQVVRVVQRLRMALAAFPDAPDWLLPIEHQRVATWVRNALDPSAPMASPQNLEFTPWGELELLLLNPELADVWPRILALMDRLSVADLRQKTQAPDSEGLTLQLRLARALLDIPNANVNTIRMPESHAGALAGLDRLVERLGPSGWGWEGRGHNVWHWALGWNINLPVDQDLMAAQQSRLSVFIEWCRRRAVPTPQEVRWEHQGRSFCTPLEDEEAFVSDWAEGGNPHRGEDPHARWHLIEPAARLLQKNRLDVALPSASPARRLRM